MPILGDIIQRGVSLSSKVRFTSQSAILQQEKMLKKLLRKATPTAFGTHYNFSEILQSDDVFQAFQAHVPIFDYNAIYKQWWHRSLAQEPNVCWPGKIKYFALSSGTSGAPSKYIPVTTDLIKANKRASMELFLSLPNYKLDTSIYTKPMMLLGGCVDLEDKGGYFVGDLSGINAKTRPFWFSPFYKPGPKIAKLKNWNERIDEIVKNAPKWDIGVIGGIPAWVHLMLERIVSTHGLETIHDIWPNLQVYATGGVAFDPYRKAFDALTNRPLSIMDTYLASEGFVAVQTRPETRAMKMLLDNGIFFEFIPFNADNFDEEGQLRPNPEVLTIKHVEEGVDYALILSTCAGTWRYMIGDTVRFTDLHRNEIIITGRTQHFLSICGEHLSIANMNKAVEMLEDEIGISIKEFTVAGIQKNDRFTHKWYLANETNVDKNRVQQILDNNLKIVNDDYATERSAVLDIELELVPTHLFYKWHEQKGKLGGQHKFPRVMKQERFEQWETFVQNELN